MWMTEYTKEIKKALRDQHHIEPTRTVGDEPLFENLPDGDYPMVIAGKLDRVRVVKGCFECCRFDEPIPRQGMTHRYEMWCTDGNGKPLLLGWSNDPKAFVELVDKWPGKSNHRAIDLKPSAQNNQAVRTGTAKED